MSSSQKRENKNVTAIDIQGNKTISNAQILSKIKTKVGQEYLPSVISDDLKRIYNMGYFTADTRVDREDFQNGFKVIFYVYEKPLVDKITFSRLAAFNPKALTKKIKTRKGGFLDNKILMDDVKTIEDMYAKKGYNLVSVQAEKEIDGILNKASVHFVIKESQRLKIKKIQIEGNYVYRDKKILRLIKTRADSLFTSGYLKEEILEEDMSRIKSFYEQNGFIDAAAAYEYQGQETGRLTLTINIQEGKRYYVDEMNVAGNKVLSQEEIFAVMTEIKPAGIFSRERLTVDLANIRTLYFDKGYIFADVTETTTLNPETGKVQVKLDVDEGNLAYVNKIKIQGNTRTKDIVIRRELRLYPGEQFDGAKLRRSKERLRNLGYFEDIGYDVEDTSVPDKKNLIVQVKEAKTGAFSFGGGYSTVEQLVGFVEIEQKNFDFLNWPTFTGGGQQLVLRAETGSTRNNLRLSFTEPWLLGYPVSGGFDAFRTEREREENTGYAYDEKRVGGDIRFGKQFSEYITGSMFYRNEEITIDNFVDNVSADLLAESGKNRVSSLGFTLARDARDNVFSPRRGLFVSGSADVAGGFLQGDKDFYRLSSTASYYIPLTFQSVLELTLRTGIVNDYGDSESVPIFERFFAGGARTIRGYNERKVGPLDPVTEDPVGGEALLVGNVELTIPLMEYIKFATFFDIGNVWEKYENFGTGSLKSGAGIGLRVRTPVGPINLDYGYPLNDEPGEEERTGKFYFSVSRGF